jgi:hypothetical protein
MVKNSLYYNNVINFIIIKSNFKYRNYLKKIKLEKLNIAGISIINKACDAFIYYLQKE